MGNGTRKPSRSTPLSRVDQGPDSASAVRHSHDQVTVSFRVEAAGIPIGTVCPDRAPKRGILVDVPNVNTQHKSISVAAGRAETYPFVTSGRPASHRSAVTGHCRDASESACRRGKPSVSRFSCCRSRPVS